MLGTVRIHSLFSVYLRKGNIDFLSFYSVLAGPARKVIYVLIGFSVTLACWRFSLERLDPDRHVHFVTRYHIPNSHPWIWLRNLLCATAFGLGFLLTLIMVPLDDYMENEWVRDPIWYTKTTELPAYFTDRITHWYAMAMVRLVCVSIGWICIIHRFGHAGTDRMEWTRIDAADRLHARWLIHRCLLVVVISRVCVLTEFQYLQLEQEKYEKRNQFNQSSFTPLTNTTGLSRTSRGGMGTGMYGGAESGIPTARSSRVSSQRVMQSTNNGGATRTEPLNASNMTIPPRR
jgi:hypothetical protein